MHLFAPMTLALAAYHATTALAAPTSGSCKRKAEPAPAPAPAPEPSAAPAPEPSAAPAPVTGGTTTTKYPFSHIVAFGDNLSDNGSGSVAHGVAQQGDPSNKIYGASTWTNGLVAVSYLANSLNMPLNDYAFGHANGGSLFGATIDNAYTQSTAHAPSSKDQIANFSSSKFASSASSAMAFLWIGANDINLYHMQFLPTSDNSGFAEEFSTRLQSQVQTLINLGFKSVFVPNLYAKHISPSKEFYASNAAEYAIMGKAINQANKAIEAKLKKFGSKVVVFNAFHKMVNIWNNHNDHGITHVGNEFCDGYSQLDWDLCVTKGLGSQFYWMQYLDMTTHVHKLLADGMLTSIKNHFGTS